MLFRSVNLIVLSIAAAGLCLLSAACSTTSTTEEPAIGVPQQPPTDPAQVAILHAEPQRSYIKLGKVTVDASTDPPPPVEKIETGLKEGAAKLGADAVVLVYDYTKTTGALVTGGGWDAWGPAMGPAEVTPIESRVVVGVAIKYQ